MAFDPSKYGAKEVFDPSKYGAAEISAQQPSQQSSQEQKPIIDIGSKGLGGRLWSDIIAGGAEGGQTLHNLPYSTAKTIDQLLGLLGGAIGKEPSFKYSDYMPKPTSIDFAQMFGAKQDLPEKLLRGSISYMPEALAGGGSIAGQALAGGITGTTQSQDNPLLGATIGSVGGAALGSISKIPSLLNYMRPQKYLEQTIEALGGGKNVNDITKSLASDIKRNADVFKEKYKEMIAPVQDAAGDYNLYQSKLGFVPNTYKPLAKEYEGAYLGDAKKFHEDFLEKPTFDNANKLQSQLGAEARKLKVPDVATFDAKSKLNDLRNSLKEDIHNFLNKQDATGNLSNQYKNASDFYLNEYVPYKNIKSLSDIIGKKGASSASLLSAFKNPKLTAEAGIPDALKIANDLGDSGKNKIIALELAKKKNLTPSAAIKAYENLDTTGLSEYITPSMEQAIKSLSKKDMAKHIAKQTAKAASYGAGAALGINELRKYFGGAL
jgi:hypothetical protein